MKWIQLYNKIGKQPLKNLRNEDVVVFVNGEEVPITGVKFKTDGTPYLIVDKNSKSIN